MIGARSRALAGFALRFGGQPTLLAHAPGRVNLIGEHTDYNDGFVLPMALEQTAWVAARPRDDRVVRLLAQDLDSEGEFDIDDVVGGPGTGLPQTGSSAGPQPGPTWLEYPRGVAWSLTAAGHPLRGFDGVLASDVPRGAGLSSSAAVELAVAAAFLEPGPTGAGWDKRAIAEAMRRVENDWVGVSSGIMDQLIGVAAVPGHAVLIDCRSLDLTPVRLPDGASVVVLDTGTRRGLVDSAYNERRAACERVAAAYGVRALRDLTLADLAAAGPAVDTVDLRRATHVIAENDRTVAAAGALERGDVVTMGRLMSASHASLRDLFEVSSPALDALVEVAAAVPGCFGARMTGAGFGGCAVALVDGGDVNGFLEAAAAGYRESTGNVANAYVSAAGPGAGSAAL